MCWKYDKLLTYNPIKHIDKNREFNKILLSNMVKSIKAHIERKKHILNECVTKLSALNPAAVLKRGYSITRTIPDKLVIRDSKDVNINQKLEVIVSKGAIICRVERI
jgi:exodeoxyribonuclease VII large subunit